MILTKLLDYQVEAVRFIIDRGKGILFLDMGMGKTLTSIACFNIWERLGQAKRAFVITPKSTIDTWSAEIKKHSSYKVNQDFYLTSPDWAKRHVDDILSDFDTDTVLILDECTYYSNPQSTRSQEIKRLTEYYDKVILLTGTLTENNLKEVYGQVSLIDKCLGENYWHFQNKYFRRIWLEKKKVNIFVPKRDSLQQITRQIQNVAFVRQKSLVPIKKIVPLQFTLSQAQLTDIDKALEDGISSIVELNYINQIASAFRYIDYENNYSRTVVYEDNPKMDLLLELLEKTPNMSAVIWYWYIHEGEDINQAIRSRGYGNEILIRQLRSGCRGVNLTHIDYAIYYSIPLSGGVFQQSQDRLYRLGRKQDVNNVVLIPAHEAFEKLLKMMVNKEKLKWEVFQKLKGKIVKL